MSRNYRRPDGAPYRLFQTTVDPHTVDAFKAAAKRQGITLSLYLDRLVTDLEADGALPAVTLPVREGEELPINFAA